MSLNPRTALVANKMDAPSLHSGAVIRALAVEDCIPQLCAECVEPDADTPHWQGEARSKAREEIGQLASEESIHARRDLQMFV